ncbi:hypothetical protein OG948_33545 [Embleya sp. NBC_00888]|uniref:hypothetical protein n=1 Tax=Embleya sp. NBC_00888 TaxID=2975960 RepID=UPI0038648042|nr:hypothetical protein OG948_33545 [Embleya sp. NBC_00888]
MALRKLLRPEHFEGGRVPTRNAFYEHLAGRDVTWEFVEAVADVCSDDYPTARRRLDEARVLWDALRQEPANSDETSEIVRLQRRVIEAQDEIRRLGEALTSSEHTRDEMTRVVRFLRIVVAQMSLRMADLIREHDAILARGRSDDPDLGRLQRRLHDTENSRAEAEEQRDHAEHARAEAQELADRLAYQIQLLNMEVARLRHPGDVPTPPSDRGASLDVWRPDPADDFLDDARAVLDRTRRLIEDGEDTLDSARAHLVDTEDATSTATTLAGEVVEEPLSRTTPNNPTTSTGTEIVLAAEHGPAIPDVRTHPREFGTYLAHLRRTRREDLANHVLSVVARPVSQLPPWHVHDVVTKLGRARPTDGALLALHIETAGGQAPPDELLYRAGRRATGAELPDLLRASGRFPRPEVKSEILRGIVQRPCHGQFPYGALLTMSALGLLVFLVGKVTNFVRTGGSKTSASAEVLLGSALTVSTAGLPVAAVGVIITAWERLLRRPTWLEACVALEAAGRPREVEGILRAAPRSFHSTLRRELMKAGLTSHLRLVAPRPRDPGLPRWWNGPQPAHHERGTLVFLAPTVVALPAFYTLTMLQPEWWIVLLTFFASCCALATFTYMARPRPGRTWWYGLARQNPDRNGTRLAE